MKEIREPVNDWKSVGELGEPFFSQSVGVSASVLKIVIVVRRELGWYHSWMLTEIRMRYGVICDRNS